jgi:pyridinium-3,5-bisthiocarboxylic acid mononucleotide nickel chelatase
VAWVDAGAGASGDMLLGALVDVGVPLSVLRRAVDALGLEGLSLRSRRVVRQGLAARKVSVRSGETRAHRRWKDIERILRRASLDEPVRNDALRVFRRLFDAESLVHGVPPDEVHLHEAGALDALADVVGACAGFRHLRADRLVVSPLTTGSGTVRCRHGLYPVPGPATTILIRDVPAGSGGAEGERLTPTGAAILTTLAGAWGPLPGMRIERIGHGAGDLDFDDRPNVLRILLGRADAPDRIEPLPAEAPILVLTFTVDDAPPQVLAYASDRLFESGALEVYTTPVLMKKGRSGHQLTVLARPEDLDALARVAFRETTTLGLRFRYESRVELQRKHVRVRTPWGPVRIKVGLRTGDPIQAWPEFEDCAALARREAVPLKQVQRAALDAYAAAGPARRKESR